MVNKALNQSSFEILKSAISQEQQGHFLHADIVSM